MYSKRDSVVDDEDKEAIQVAVLADAYSFEDMKVDMAMDGKFPLFSFHYFYWYSSNFELILIEKRKL